MKSSVVTDIEMQLLGAVSGITTNVYLNYLPDAELLSQFNIVWKVSTNTLQSTFENPTAIEEYNVEVNVIYSDVKTVIQYSEPIINALQSLPKINTSVNYVLKSDEKIEYDDDYQCYVATTNFKLTVS